MSTFPSQDVKVPSPIRHRTQRQELLAQLANETVLLRKELDGIRAQQPRGLQVILNAILGGSYSKVSPTTSTSAKKAMSSSVKSYLPKWVR